MRVSVEPGTYVVAVSGGVDSMVLLDVLCQKPGLQLIVAHFDHGIRPDSELDRKLVQQVADKHGLSFVFDRVELGPSASEATAREARYDFLNRVRDVTGARAIVTAHHQDDLIETAILNLLRGTGRKGLTSLADHEDIKRPMLDKTKKQLLDYAKKNGLVWREDATNTDTKYKRNYVREHVVKKLSTKQRQEMLSLLEKTKATNKQIDTKIAVFLKFMEEGKKLDRKLFVSLPHAVALEVIAGWLRQNNIRQFDQKLLNRLVTTAKTLPPGKQVDVDSTHVIKISKQSLALESRSR